MTSPSANKIIASSVHFDLKNLQQHHANSPNTLWSPKHPTNHHLSPHDAWALPGATEKLPLGMEPPRLSFIEAKQKETQRSRSLLPCLAHTSSLPGEKLLPKPIQDEKKSQNQDMSDCSMIFSDLLFVTSFISCSKRDREEVCELIRIHLFPIFLSMSF